MSEYRINNELLIKLHKHVKEHRQKMNLMIDSLESEVFQLSLNTQQTFSKILGFVDQIKSKHEIIENFNLSDFISQNKFNDKFILLFTQFDKILKRLNLTIHLQDNEWIIHKNTEIIAKTKTLKSKIQLVLLKYPEKINEFNPLYEECKDKKLIIELNDNFKIWEIIELRLG